MVLVLAAADVTLRRDVAFDLALPFLGAALLGFRDFAMERVAWYWAPLVRASVLTFARPKAPHIARRALRVSPGGHVHRPAPIAMRPLREKSSRFLSRGIPAFGVSGCR